MRILIVDDEERIRNHLANMKEWGDLGCQITGVAADGVEALQRISVDKPDLVITDIRMPLMDGIQLAEQIKAGFPHIRFLFLTAYSDFQYAQHAVKLGAVDFILKPIQTAELLHAVELLMQGGERASQDNSLRQEQTIQLMLSANVKETYKEEVLHEMKLEDRHILVICVVIDNGDVLNDSGEVLSLLALKEAVIGSMIYYPYDYWVYLDRKGMYLILFQPTVQMWSMREDSLKMARDMLECCKASLPFTVSIGVSKIQPSLAHLAEAWKEIKDCFDYRMLLGKGSIISYDALPGLIEGQINREEEQLRELAGMLRRGEKERVQPYLLTISREMMLKGLTKTNIHTFALRIIQRGEELLEEYHLYTSEEVRLQVHKTVLSFDILVDLMQYLERWAQETADRIATVVKQSMNGLIKEISTYLRVHSTEDMTLPRLAEQFHMNPSYLSRLIKKETGQNFRDLLWYYRIEEAKHRLVQTNLKANEIAYEVGFKDPAHFSILFKKHVGLSPTSYRAQIK